ncbi:MAG: O-antigen ligase family protein, partial [Bryobacterales bacterium]
LVGMTFTPDRAVAANDLVNLVAVFGLLVLFARAKHDRKVILWVGLLNASTAAVGGGVYSWLRMTGQVRDLNHNAFSYFPLAGLFAICMAYPLAPPKSRAQTGFLAMAVANLLWIYLSGSRGGLITAVICFLYILHSTRGVSAKWFGLASALVIGLITIQTFGKMNENAAHRYTKLFDDELSDTNKTSGRSDLFVYAADIFLDYPLGVGTGGFANAYSRYLTGDLESDHMKVSHSAWMKTLVENGILGAFVLLVFVASFAMEGISSGHYLARQLGIISSIILGVSFLTREFQGKALWFLAAGASYLITTRFQCLRRPVRLRVGWGYPERNADIRGDGPGSWADTVGEPQVQP